MSYIVQLLFYKDGFGMPFNKETKLINFFVNTYVFTQQSWTQDQVFMWHRRIIEFIIMDVPLQWYNLTWKSYHLKPEPGMDHQRLRGS